MKTKIICLNLICLLSSDVRERARAMMTTILELLKIREQINKIRFIQQLTFVGCFVVEPFKGDALIQLTY